MGTCYVTCQAGVCMLIVVQDMLQVAHTQVFDKNMFFSRSVKLKSIITTSREGIWIPGAPLLALYHSFSRKHVTRRALRDVISVDHLGDDYRAWTPELWEEDWAVHSGMTCKHSATFKRSAASQPVKKLGIILHQRSKPRDIVRVCVTRRSGSFCVGLTALCYCW